MRAKDAASAARTPGGRRSTPLPVVLADHAFFVRPLLFAPAAAMVLIGRRTGAATGGEAPAPADAWAAIACLFFALAATHVANQLADRRSDRANAKLPHLALGLVSARTAIAIASLCAAACVALLPFVPASLRALDAAALALGAAYSIRPLCLKSRAGWDLAANALGYGGIAFAVGWGSAGSVFWPRVVAAAVPWMLAVGAVFASTTVVDEPGDRAAGLPTLAVRFGPTAARWCALLSMAAAAAASLVLRARLPLALSALSIPPLLAAIVRPSRRADHVAFQASAAIPVLYAAVRFPAFGAALVAAAIATRAYHAMRFGLRYPALGEPRAASGARPSYDPAFGLRTTSVSAAVSSRYRWPSSSGQ